MHTFQSDSESESDDSMDEMPLSRRIVPSSLHAARAQRVDSSSSSEADDSELNSESEPASESEWILCSFMFLNFEHLIWLHFNSFLMCGFFNLKLLNILIQDDF